MEQRSMGGGVHVHKRLFFVQGAAVGRRRGTHSRHPAMCRLRTLRSLSSGLGLGVLGLYEGVFFKEIG